MFDRQVYVDRRRTLQTRLGSGLVLLLGNDNSSINFSDNHYPFRQDSTFLYYFGLNQPGLVGIIDVDNDVEALLGHDIEMSSIIWEGKQPSLGDLAAQAGVKASYPLAQVGTMIQRATTGHQKVHFLPPYRPEQENKLSTWLGVSPSSLPTDASVALTHAIVSQRSYKSPEEVAEIEKAIAVGIEMQFTVMRTAQAGMKEAELLGQLYQVALASKGNISFAPIVTVRGQILHNHHYDNTLTKGQMLLCDCGAETSMGYASDLTRTFPVDSTFDARQKEVYEIVFNAHQTAIKALKPGILFKDVHLLACETLVDGLKAIGLMKGDPREAVQAGAHALFFQCGLGHMMGLDVHDMENLGEQYVGYTPELPKSTEFGLRSLRLGRALEAGFVITIEPGIYLIPELIDEWQSTHTHAEFIRYDQVASFKDFGGIRLEDDFLITPDGYQALSSPLPVDAADIENLRSH